jgi:hypothetical protein
MDIFEELVVEGHLNKAADANVLLEKVNAVCVVVTPDYEVYNSYRSQQVWVPYKPL